MQFGLRSVAVLLVALATGPDVPREGFGGAARCYALSFGAWTIGSEPLDLHRPLPEGIALTDSLFWPAEAGRPATYWAIRLRDSATDHRRAFWSRRGADSVVIQLPAWWSTGIGLALPAHGDTLRGRASVYVDYSPTVPTVAAVTAYRRACPPFKIQ